MNKSIYSFFFRTSCHSCYATLYRSRSKRIFFNFQNNCWYQVSNFLPAHYAQSYCHHCYFGQDRYSTYRRITFKKVLKHLPEFESYYLFNINKFNEDGKHIGWY